MKKSRSVPDVPARGKSKTKASFQEERVREPLKALTETQGHYIKALKASPQIIVLGPAGTGKTYIAGTHAADQLLAKKVERIIITRPNVPGGRSLGFFKGSLAEKIAPWVVPLTEVISQRMGKGAFESAMNHENIEIVPFEVMRGRTFKNCIVILDEAQNTTAAEIKMFLTRIGDDCQVIINGDVSQTDLTETSGLRTIIRMIKSRLLPVPIIEFSLDDIVRSGICEMWVRAFEDEKL